MPRIIEMSDEPIKGNGFQIYMRKFFPSYSSKTVSTSAMVPSDEPCKSRPQAIVRADQIAALYQQNTDSNKYCRLGLKNKSLSYENIAPCPRIYKMKSKSNDPNNTRINNADLWKVTQFPLTVERDETLNWRFYFHRDIKPVNPTFKYDVYNKCKARRARLSLLKNAERKQQAQFIVCTKIFPLEFKQNNFPCKTNIETAWKDPTDTPKLLPKYGGRAADMASLISKLSACIPDFDIPSLHAKVESSCSTPAAEDTPAGNSDTEESIESIEPIESIDSSDESSDSNVYTTTTFYMMPSDSSPTYTRCIGSTVGDIRNTVIISPIHVRTWSFSETPKENSRTNEYYDCVQQLHKDTLIMDELDPTVDFTDLFKGLPRYDFNPSWFKNLLADEPLARCFFENESPPAKTPKPKKRSNRKLKF